MSWSKGLRVVGLLCLVAFVGLLGYACYGEQEVRKQFTGKTSVDFGFMPLDLLEGRTRYERREDDRVVVSLNTGPNGEMRSTIARVGAGIGLLGAVLILSGLVLGKRSGGVTRGK